MLFEGLCNLCTRWLTCWIDDRSGSELSLWGLSTSRMKTSNLLPILLFLSQIAPPKEANDFASRLHHERAQLFCSVELYQSNLGLIDSHLCPGWNLFWMWNPITCNEGIRLHGKRIWCHEDANAYSKILCIHHGSQGHPLPEPQCPANRRLHCDDGCCSFLDKMWPRVLLRVSCWCVLGWLRSETQKLVE